MPTALTDVSDVGRYVARIIADPRTLNRMVFAYGEVITANQVSDLVEKVSGEKIQRNYVSFDLIDHGKCLYRFTNN